MIKCKLCGFYYKVLTTSHMKSWHGITLDSYKEKFPNSEVTSKEMRNVWSKAQLSRYEEIPMPESTKKLLSASLIGYDYGKEHGRKISKSLRGRELSEEHRRNISMSNLGSIRGPHSPETIEKIRQGVKENHLSRDPRWIETLRKSCQAYWDSEVGRITAARIARERVTPEYKETLSKMRKKMWAEDKNYQRAQARANSRRPNLSEIWLGSILEGNFPREWKFVGSGDVTIGGKLPDFINIDGKELIIELFGFYWHLPGEEKERQDYFEKYGFKTLIVWDYELGDANLIDRIREFASKV